MTVDKYYELRNTMVRVAYQDFMDRDEMDAPEGTEWRLPNWKQESLGLENYMVTEVHSEKNPAWYNVIHYIKADVLDSACREMPGIDFTNKDTMEKLITCVLVSGLSRIFKSNNYHALDSMLTEEDLENEEENIKNILHTKGTVEAAKAFSELL